MKQSITPKYIKAFAIVSIIFMSLFHFTNAHSDYIYGENSDLGLNDDYYYPGEYFDEEYDVYEESFDDLYAPNFFLDVINSSNNNEEKAFFSVIFVAFLIGVFLLNVLVGFLMFSKRNQNISRKIINTFKQKNVFWKGILASLAIFILMLSLLISVIGFPIALYVGLLIAMTTVPITVVFTSYLFSKFVFKTEEVSKKSIFLSQLIYLILVIIPYIGALISLVVAFFVTGILYILVKELFTKDTINE